MKTFKSVEEAKDHALMMALSFKELVSVCFEDCCNNGVITINAEVSTKDYDKRILEHVNGLSVSGSVNHG